MKENDLINWIDVPIGALVELENGVCVIRKSLLRGYTLFNEIFAWNLQQIKQVKLIKLDFEH